MYSHIHVPYTGCMHTNPAGNALGPVSLAWCWPEMQGACQGSGWEANSILPAGGCADDNSITGGRLPSCLGKQLGRPLAPKQSQWLSTWLRVWVTWVWSQQEQEKRALQYLCVFLSNSVLSWHKRQCMKSCTEGKNKNPSLNLCSRENKSYWIVCCLWMFLLTLFCYLFTHFSNSHQKACGIWCQGFQENPTREKS